MIAIKSAFKVLCNPEREFQKIGKKTFENMLSDYLKLLLIVSIVASLFVFVSSFIKSYWFWFFNSLDINFARMINYMIGKATAVFFLYLFSGTFILFFISFLVKPFEKGSYITLLKKLFLAVSPLLLFSWIPFFVPSLIIWCIFIFIVGIKFKDKRMDRGSIKERD